MKTKETDTIMIRQTVTFTVKVERSCETEKSTETTPLVLVLVTKAN